MLLLFGNLPAKTSFITLLGSMAVLFCLAAGFTKAQSIKPQVKISIASPSEVKIFIKQVKPTSGWSFRNTYGRALGLGDRIEQFQATRSNEPILVKKIASGEFRSDVSAESLSYVVRLPSIQTADATQVSWINEDHGFLMFADLLPEFLESQAGLSVKFELPKGWVVRTALDPDDHDSYLVENPETAVFFVGQELRPLSKLVRGMPLRIFVSNKWDFADKDVLKSASEVLQQYLEMTGFKLRGRPTIFLAPLPLLHSNAQWKAETRGSTVMMLLNRRADIKNWRGQLGVIFTHELLHLWVPNALVLKGDYDWFFEGFTLYVALQAALKLKLIKFQEYLDTLGRVYDSYLSFPNEQTLIQASASRWTSSVPLVYDKGMLVAFIYDLMVRAETQGQLSLVDRYRSLFVRFADEPADANDVIISLLTSSPATSNFAKSYIESRNRIDLDTILPQFGLHIETDGSNSRVRVSEKLTDEQKNLLRSLGYRK